MKKTLLNLLSALILLSSADAYSEQPVNIEPESKHYPDYQLKHFNEDEQGFLQNMGTDSYLVITDLDLARDQLCNLGLTIEFKETLVRPALFEVFWAAESSGFKENQKAAFLINQTDTTRAKTFIVPLCKLYNFSGNLNTPSYQANINRLRLDYPSNKTVSIKFDAIEFLTNQEASKLIANDNSDNVIKIEAYERIVGKSFTSLDAIVPKLIFAFEQGLNRLSIDRAFLVFWLLIIFSLIALFIRSFRRS